MTKPPELHKEWVRRFRELVPGEIRVTNYYDEDESHSVPIVTSRQADGVVGATIGLMDVDQSRNPEVTIRSEVIMDVRGDVPQMENVLATIAFFIIKDGWRIRPGAIFERIVEMHLPDLSVPHVYFTAPFQWGEKMSRVPLADGNLYPLLALPISQGELELMRGEGDAALESLWESKGTDVLDWHRGSAA